MDYNFDFCFLRLQEGVSCREEFKRCLSDIVLNIFAMPSL